MVNKVLNDKHEWVAAIGSKGSIARIACEFPAAIELIEKLRRRAASIEDVKLLRMVDSYEELRKMGVPARYQGRIIEIAFGEAIPKRY